MRRAGQGLRGRRSLGGRGSGPALSMKYVEPQIMALHDHREVCNKGKEEARLIKEVFITVGVGGLGRPTSSTPLEGALVPTPSETSRPLLLSGLEEPRPGLQIPGERPWAALLLPLLLLPRLCRLGEWPHVLALARTCGRGCGWGVCRRSPGVAGQASHPQQKQRVAPSAVPNLHLPSLAPKPERDHAGPEASPTRPTRAPAGEAAQHWGHLRVSLVAF